MAGLLVDGATLAGLKAVRAPDKALVAQCVDYLAATGVRLCLLPDFGMSRVEARRSRPQPLSQHAASA